MVHRSCFHVLLHPRLQIRGFSFLKTYESRFFPPLPPPPPFLFPRWPNERVLSFEELRFSISRVVFPFLLLRFSVTIQDEDVIRSREREKKGETNKRESSIFQKIERGRKMHSRGRKMQLVPCFGGVEIVLCLWITSAVLTLVASQQKFYIQGRYGKRQEPRTDSFYVSGGRYGRESESGVASKSQLAKLVEAEVPRIDRFVWGGRYDGKRSPPIDYRPVSSVNRFSAVLDFMDQVDLDREKNDLGNRNELDFLP